LAARGGALQGFTVAGADRKFFAATATLDGDAVLVSSSFVPLPVAARYAWANNPVCNLYNAADLPASPFRTDSWPGVTAGR
jgi:sialate O-acetylesterase